MSAISTTTTDASATPFAALLERFAERRAAAGGARTIGYREAGAAYAAHAGRDPVVLLHGIGSGAASWVRQLDALGATRRALAWDAPGYGVSSRVAADSPVASDYAASLAAWLDALRIERCVLVGHSLGAIVAGAFARQAGERLSGLLLISPAAC